MKQPTITRPEQDQINQATALICGLAADLGREHITITCAPDGEVTYRTYARSEQESLADLIEEATR